MIYYRRIKKDESQEKKSRTKTIVDSEASQALLGVMILWLVYLQMNKKTRAGGLEMLNFVY
jgi:hypothetical protein